MNYYQFLNKADEAVPAFKETIFNLIYDAIVYHGKENTVAVVAWSFLVFLLLIAIGLAIVIIRQNMRRDDREARQRENEWGKEESNDMGEVGKDRE